MQKIDNKLLLLLLLVPSLTLQAQVRSRTQATAPPSDASSNTASTTLLPLDATAFGMSPLASGKTNTASLLAAINALPTQGGKIIIPGVMTGYAFDPLTITNRSGIIIEGVGDASNLMPTEAARGRSVLTLVNCRELVIRDLRISGNAQAPPAAAIESVAGNPHLQAAMRLKLSNLLIGSDDANGLVDGIKFTADATPKVCNDAMNGCDQNNEQAEITGVEIRNFSGAGISIQGANSLLHRIIGGSIMGGAVGVRLKGGSFSMIGTNLIGLNDVQFDFLTPEGKGGYYHPSFVTNVSTESCSRIIRTTRAGDINIFFTGYNNKFSQEATDIIDFQSIGGTFQIVNSFILTGAPGASARFTDPQSKVVFRDSYLDFKSLVVNGRLDAQGVTSTSIPAPATFPRAAFAIKKSDYIVKPSDSVILVDAAARPVTITVPGSQMPEGFTVTIKKIDSTPNAVIITDLRGSNLIEYTSQSITKPMSFLTLAFNLRAGEAVWYIIGKG
jgi:hypothetical protein